MLHLLFTGGSSTLMHLSHCYRPTGLEAAELLVVNLMTLVDSAHPTSDTLAVGLHRFLRGPERDNSRNIFTKNRSCSLAIISHSNAKPGR